MKLVENGYTKSPLDIVGNLFTILLMIPVVLFGLFCALLWFCMTFVGWGLKWKRNGFKKIWWW